MPMMFHLDLDSKIFILLYIYRKYIWKKYFNNFCLILRLFKLVKKKKRKRLPYRIKLTAKVNVHYKNCQFVFFFFSLLNWTSLTAAF